MHNKTLPLLYLVEHRPDIVVDSRIGSINLRALTWSTVREHPHPMYSEYRHGVFV